MNRKILFCIAAFILFIPLFSAAETVEIDKDVLEKILQQQRELEKSVESLQLQLDARNKSPAAATPPEPAASPLADDVEYLKDEVEYMSGRLDSTEKKSILDKVQIGGELRVRGDWLNFDNMKDAEGVEKDGRIDELWSSRLRLHLRSEITENLIFNGRLSYLKYWGETNFDKDPFDSRSFILPDPDGNLHVERAYVDWFIPDTPLSITFGRLPLTEGPPHGFRNYTTRKSTWAQSLFDGENDGVILNVELKQWTGLKDALFHTAYLKVTQNYKEFEGLDVDDARVWVASFEMPFPGIDDSLLWLAGFRYWNFPSLGWNQDIPLIFPDESMSAENVMAHVQFNNILKTGFGWFGAFGYQWLHPRPEGTVFAPGVEIGAVGDSLHGDLGEDKSGFFVYTGFRYIIPSPVFKNPLIGCDYYYASRNYIPPGNFLPGEYTNKMGVNGHAYDIYYVQPIMGNRMFARIGAVYQDFDYYFPRFVYGSREGNESDMSILNTYFLVDVRF